MERLVHSRLTWLLERYQVLPDELCGFRNGSSTAEAIAVISSAIEVSKANRQTMHIAFLN